MKRSKFNLSHEVLLTTDFGSLTPILCQECLPGDKFRISTEMFTRFQALIAPVMQRVDAKIEYFFVPNRIIMDGWRDYITHGDENVSLPVLSMQALRTPSASGGPNLAAKNTLADYLGLPVDYKVIQPDGTTSDVMSSSENINALPFIAYQRIWYDWYADQNIQSSELEALQDQQGEFNKYLSGSVNAALYGQLRYRCYPRDYFTSSLPWAQAGDPARVPLTYPGGKTSLTSSVASGDLQVASYVVKAGTSSAQFGLASPQNVVMGPTIEELRRTNAIQRWLEKNARYGRRYVEQIAAHFGVRVPDYRLDRSEYLGSNKAPISVSEVLQQSQTTSESPLGDFAGHAVSGGVASMRTYRCDEHGWIIGLLSFVPRASYAEGLPKMFRKNSYLDFAFPEFDRIGEQPINYEEVDAYGSGNQVFGYVPRYWEYKRAYNRFCGEFRDSLAYWHLGRLWNSAHQPALNSSFITIDGGQDGRVNERIFAVQDGNTPHILVQLYHHISAIRPLSHKAPTL